MNVNVPDVAWLGLLQFPPGTLYATVTVLVPASLRVTGSVTDPEASPTTVFGGAKM